MKTHIHIGPDMPKYYLWILGGQFRGTQYLNYSTVLHV